MRVTSATQIPIRSRVEARSAPAVTNGSSIASGSGNTLEAGPDKLASWCGMTPKHRESDTRVHRGRITKQGSRLVRWAAVESVQTLPKTTTVGAMRDRIADRRGRNIGVVAAAHKQLGYVYYALRDHHVRALQQSPPPKASAA